VDIREEVINQKMAVTQIVIINYKIIIKYWQISIAWFKKKRKLYYYKKFVYVTFVYVNVTYLLCV